MELTTRVSKESISVRENLRNKCNKIHITLELEMLHPCMCKQNYPHPTIVSSKQLLHVSTVQRDL